MTTKNKREIITQIVLLLSQLAETTDEQSAAAVVSHEDKPVEMLTIKECTQTVPGISEHTIRQLIRQNKLPYTRAGKGERGKILISKNALLDYFNKTA